MASPPACRVPPQSPFALPTRQASEPSILDLGREAESPGDAQRPGLGSASQTRSSSQEGLPQSPRRVVVMKTVESRRLRGRRLALAACLAKSGLHPVCWVRRQQCGPIGLLWNRDEGAQGPCQGVGQARCVGPGSAAQVGTVGPAVPSPRSGEEGVISDSLRTGDHCGCVFGGSNKSFTPPGTRQ